MKTLVAWWPPQQQDLLFAAPLIFSKFLYIHCNYWDEVLSKTLIWNDPWIFEASWIRCKQDRWVWGGGGGASINKPRQRWQPVLIQGSALTIGQPIRPPSTWLDYPRCFHPRFFLGQGLPLPTNQTNQPLLTLFQGGSDPLMAFSGFRSSEQERWWRQIWTSIEMFYSEKAQLSNIWPLTFSNLQGVQYLHILCSVLSTN